MPYSWIWLHSAIISYNTWDSCRWERSHEARLLQIPVALSKGKYPHLFAAKVSKTAIEIHNLKKCHCLWPRHCLWDCTTFFNTTDEYRTVLSWLIPYILNQTSLLRVNCCTSWAPFDAHHTPANSTGNVAAGCFPLLIHFKFSIGMWSICSLNENSTSSLEIDALDGTGKVCMLTTLPSSFILLEINSFGISRGEEKWVS